MTCWPAMGPCASGSIRHGLSSVQPQIRQTPVVFGIGVFLESTLPHLDELFHGCRGMARIVIVDVDVHRDSAPDGSLTDVQPIPEFLRAVYNWFVPRLCLPLLSYSSFAYSALACLSMGMSESASFQSARKSS